MIEPFADDLLLRIAVSLERIAAALESGGGFGALAPADPRLAAIAEIRSLIREGVLVEAGDLLKDFQFKHPDAAETTGLLDDLDRTTRATVEDLKARLAAARKANSPEISLDLREQLAPLLAPSERDPVDRDLLAWLMNALIKRLRTGTISPDVAILAARIANAFPHRSEGASLKASLPTLRRSAGLCARCAEPYTGEEDACPKCLAVVPKIAELPESPDPPT